MACWLVLLLLLLLLLRLLLLRANMNLPQLYESSVRCYVISRDSQTGCLPIDAMHSSTPAQAPHVLALVSESNVASSSPRSSPFSLHI